MLRAERLCLHKNLCPGHRWKCWPNLGENGFERLSNEWFLALKSAFVYPDSSWIEGVVDQPLTYRSSSRLSKHNTICLYRLGGGGEPIQPYRGSETLRL